MRPEQPFIPVSTPPPTPSILVSAATTLGRVAGKLAGTVAPSPVPPAAPKVAASGKLAKKHKYRLPRRQKKALQRATKTVTSAGGVQ